MATALAPYLRCYPRRFGGGGCINCGEPMLGTVEEEDQSYSRVSVLAILAFNPGTRLTGIYIFNLFVGTHICWLIV
jgi:hypothetical protein